MEQRNRKRACELLSPAGNMDCLVAAVRSGADAVYFGGAEFNARINAGNFSRTEVEKAVDFVHLRGAKAYVTLNTLLYDDELPRALDYASFLYEAGVDALIIQDLGLARLLRERFPDFPLHLSTQGTIYNVSGARAAARLGFCRIVPARELTVEEIRTIAQSVQAEIEVFVHGALCICYSGQCQMSRINGGRSGNRGMCAQPCRLPYEGGGARYPLSPKDLCLIDRLPELAEAGAVSLKIEGRMKSPEYVAVVTSIYRKYLDRYLKKGSYQVEPSDMQMLLQSFNRGGFTEGYFNGDPREALMADDIPKNWGLPVGRVVEPKAGKYGIVEIDTSCWKGDGAAVSLGDGVEIRGASGSTGNVVTYLQQKTNNSILRIGDFRDLTEKGDLVYRTTEKALTEQARLLAQREKRLPVDMTFTAAAGEPSVLTVSEPRRGSTAGCSVKIEGPAGETAVRRALTEETVQTQLSKTGDMPFVLRHLYAHIEEDTALSLSVLNAMRREALAALTAQITARAKRSAAMAAVCPEEAQNAPCQGRKMLPPTAPRWQQNRLYVPLVDFMSDPQWRGRSEVLPYICNVSRGVLDQFVEAHFAEIADACRETGLAIGNMGWIREFRDAGVRIYGDYGLNVLNRAAEAAAAELGAEETMWSLECFSPEERGGFPAMISEHLFPEGRICSRDRSYRIRRLSSGDKTVILSEGKPCRIY